LFAGLRIAADLGVRVLDDEDVDVAGVVSVLTGEGSESDGGER
jgi:hypothetical protein